jgi:hypothetical protein
MIAAPRPFDTSPAPGDAQAVPFATSHVALTKQEHIQLVMEANSWKSRHQRAVERAQWRDQRYRRVLRQIKEQAAQREAKLCAELELVICSSACSAARASAARDGGVGLCRRGGDATDLDDAPLAAGRADPLVSPVLHVVQCAVTGQLVDRAGLKVDEGHGDAATLIQRRKPQHLSAPPGARIELPRTTLVGQLRRLTLTVQRGACERSFEKVRNWPAV